MAYITTIVVHLQFLYKWLISRLLSFIVHETFIYIFYTNGLYHDYCRSFTVFIQMAYMTTIVVQLSTKRSFTFFKQMAYITTIVVHLQFLYKWLVSRLLSFIVHETFINIFYTNSLYHDYCRSFTVFIQMAYITTIIMSCAIVQETDITIFYALVVVSLPNVKTLVIDLLAQFLRGQNIRRNEELTKMLGQLSNCTISLNLN